jgi:hypothetical protein
VRISPFFSPSATFFGSRLMVLASFFGLAFFFSLLTLTLLPFFDGHLVTPMPFLHYLPMVPAPFLLSPGSPAAVSVVRGTHDCDFERHRNPVSRDLQRRWGASARKPEDVGDRARPGHAHDVADGDGPPMTSNQRR